MIVKQVIFAVVFFAAAGFLYKNLSRIFSYLKVARPENRTDNKARRFLHTLKVAFGQRKILREKVAGPVHAAIFWGFLALLFSAAEAVFQGFYPPFTWNFLGPVYSLISFATDIFSFLVIIAITFSVLRRYVFKVKRLQGDKDEMWDAALVFGFIFLIVSSLILEKAAFIKINGLSSWAFCPLIQGISSIYPDAETAKIWHEIFWWSHILGILAFANYLPFSKHFHVYTSFQNVFFSPENIPNKLEKMDFEIEDAETFGVVDIDDLSWKNLFDSYSCTHCGRCESVCPANLTGKELSPRDVIVEVRKRTFDVAPIKLKIKEAKEKGEEYQPTESERAILEKPFIGEYLKPKALWQCLTCGACMQECPITIEHVPVIVGGRRSLVMTEANFPQELQPAFANLENQGTPWAYSPAERADWAEGLGVKTCAEDPDFDVLFWVGCSGSYDDRAKKVSVAVAKLLQKAGVNFRILGQEERCCGDPARRAGNEYLADFLIKQNVETLNSYNVKTIVTACPHGYNTLKNEYPDFGGKYEVYHHTQFLDKLIKEGKLKIKKEVSNKLKLAYHDSCYLGRYNQEFDAPRSVLKAAGAEILEPEKTKDRSFCCGAGGAQYFMEETEGKRVYVERTEQILATGASEIAVNCPFCSTMITDGLKDLDKDEIAKVRDVAEILLDSVD